MTSIEIAFLCAIYGLYLSDCIYWLGSGDQAFARVSATEWRAWRIEPLSFTLLGRTPLIVALFLLRPGFVKIRGTEIEPAESALRKVGRRLDRMYVLLLLCRVQAFLLLVYLPLLIVLHRLAAVWPIFLAGLLVVHVALSFVSIRALRQSKTVTWFTAASSIALNPLGATRAFDALSQAFFEQERTRRLLPRTRRKA